MLCLLRRWLPDRELVVVADRTYAALKLLAACQALTPPIIFLTRLRLDAVLHDPPPPRRPGQRGRPRIVGARQPSLQAVLTDPATVWTTLRQRWPDGTRRRLQAATGTALWYHPGEPTVHLSWLLLRDPTGRREPQALLCTDPDWTPTAILTACLERWQVEVTFQEVRAHLGVETQRQWSAAAIARTTPVLPGLSAGSSWSPTACAGSVPCVPAGPPGMPRPCPPSPTSWPASATSSGPGCRFFPCPRPPPTSKNSPSRRPHRCWPPSATRPDTRPPSRQPHGLCTKSSYPRILDQDLDPTRVMGDYLATYVERDVRRLGGVRNLSGFETFTRLAAGRIGQTLNLSRLGADAGVSHTTAGEWLSVLEASYIAFRLRPYATHTRKRLTKSPKLYFFDVGLAAFLLGVNEPGQMATHPLKGPCSRTRS